MKTIKFPIFFSMLVVWVGHFLVDMMIGIWPIYKTLAHLDLAVAGVIGGACAFFGEGLQIIFGTLSDRGYRKMLILGGVLATTASACLIYTENYLGVFALYLLTCIGSGAFHPSAASLVGDLASEKKGFLLAIFVSGGAFGMAVSQLVYTQTHFWLGGQMAWLAVPAMILVVSTAFSAVARQPCSRSTSVKHFDFKMLGVFFRQQPLRMLYITQVCNAIMLWGMLFLLPDLLSSRGYDSWIAFGGGHLVFVIGSAIMMMPAGYLADKYSCRLVIMVATITALIFFYILLFFPWLENFVLLSLLFGLGASIGAVNPIAVSLGTQLAPNHKGLVSAFLMGLVWCISEGIGQIGGGFLATNFMDDAPAKALSILGGIFLIGLGATYRLPHSVEEPLSLEYA